MRQYIARLRFKYNLRREYFTLLLPIVIVLMLVAVLFAAGMVDLPGAEKEATKSDREQAYEDLVKQIAEEDGGVPAPAESPVPAGSEGWPLDQVLIIAVILAITPYAIDITIEKRSIRKKEELYTEFLFKLSELMRGGLDPVKSVMELSKTNLGELNPHIRLAATAMTFGKSFEEAMMAMTGTLRSELVTRYTMLVVQASYSGGSTSDLILKASEDMRSLITIEREKEGNLSQYTMIFYFAQGILFFIAFTLTTSLLPYLQDMSSTSFLGLGGAEMATLNFATGFFHLVMINAFFGGLIIGKISEGDSRYGLKHAVILMTAGFLASTLFLFPAAEAPPPGDVRITIVSGDGQAGYPGLPLTDLLVVRVTDLEGNPIERTEVMFAIEPGGTMKPASDNTDAEGLAEATVVLGTEAERYIITATCQGVSISTGAEVTNSGE